MDADDNLTDDEAAWVREQEEEEDAGEAEEGEVAAAALRLGGDRENVPEMFDLANVISDPGIRRPIDEFGTPEIRDKMRWAYLSKGRSRLIGHNFPKTKFGPDWRRFQDAWYTKYDWIEYSVEKDAAFCFYCFLFKSSSNTSHGHDVFTKKGFKNWKKASENFVSHIGGPTSIHNNARNNCEDFRKPQKSLLQKLRDDGWEPLLLAATTFCGGRNIVVPNMDDNICARGYPRSSRKMVTCLHYYYKVQIFNEVLDRNIVEMNNRFGETSTRLLMCTACLDPRDSFSRFDHGKLVELASMYSADFSSYDCYLLSDQLNIYIDVMKRSHDFLACDSLSGLALKFVQTGHHLIFPLVYRLITLALTLPVATASVERAFSAMNIIKTDLRNKMGDDWLNDLMICYVEKEIFTKIDDKKIMLRFHSYKERRGHLPRHFRLPGI